MKIIYVKSLVFISLFLLMLLVSADTSVIMFHKWNLMSENQGHAWLLLGMFFYLAYENKHKLELAEQVYVVPLLLLVVVVIVNFFAAKFSVLLFHQFAMLGFLYFSIKSLFKIKDELQLVRLVGVLIFTTTTFDHLVPYLVNMSSYVVSHLISIYGITAFIDGPMIEIPSGSILIADSCSGVRYVIVALAIGCIMGIMENATLVSNLKLLVYSVLIALIANWLRIFLLVAIGDATEMQSSLMKDHEFFGFIVFFLCFAPLFKYRLVSREKNIASQTAIAGSLKTSKILLNMSFVIGLLIINIILQGGIA